MPGSTPLKSSFPPVVNGDTRLLICGSLPGERSLAHRQYYAHPQNQFWPLISNVIGRDLVPLPYANRLDALLEARVGLWDVVATARRKGSTDAALADIAPNDLAALAATLPHLRAVAFNGATAFKHGARQLDRSPATLISLPSSSPLHTIGIVAKLPAWLALRDHIAR
ncbi:DNA-deoxyinosine glycosylase [Sphingomonas turrisvirgatae]|uniref:DNA-deoxyinosine glycosylase n=1 Tax=Sphingomonas turrisvirgatae TaxID=1888892 RepID=A0A1E3LUZ6_9SPHN|nr:DNA-deoxyinosine glycosylase [Sphingomonas turrisvirgatae]ODP36650.1 DNA-deoxyinosine glycosylase [Sphingomonas turrisvirgatae]